MEYVNCNLCNNDHTELLFSKKDRYRITQDEFIVVECRKCGLLYINPRPTQEEIKKFYPETYSWKETLEGSSFFIKWIRKFEKVYRYHLLKDEASKAVKFTEGRVGKVLDIGCGTGDRLDVLRGIGFETYGVEISDSAEHAHEHLKLNVIKGDLFSANFKDGFFDMVMMYNVLEHTHDPTRIMIEIHRILKKEGFLIIQVPNKDSLQFRLFKERWAAFDVPRDLYYFGVDTLSSLLGKVDFHVVKIDQFMTWWHPPTLVLSLFPNLDPQKAWGQEERGRSPFFQRMAWVLCTLLASPLTHFESWAGNGAIVTCYATKSLRTRA